MIAKGRSKETEKNKSREEEKATLKRYVIEVVAVGTRCQRSTEHASQNFLPRVLDAGALNQYLIPLWLKTTPSSRNLHSPPTPPPPRPSSNTLSLAHEPCSSEKLQGKKEKRHKAHAIREGKVEPWLKSDMG